MLHKLGQFLADKINQRPAFKKGLRVAQAISSFKEVLRDDFDLSEEELKNMEFDYEKGFLVVKGKNRMLLQEIKLSSSSYREKINSHLEKDLVKGLKTERKKESS